MIVPDVNLLLYATDTASAAHQPARHWWETCLSGIEPVGLTHPVLFAYIRVGTSSKAFEHPLSLGEATERITSWLNRSVARIVHTDAGHVERVLRLLVAAGSAGGNLVTDAQIAAIAIAHHATVHTADRDFLRFPELRTHFPLDA